MASFAELAAAPAPGLDQLALALAAEFRDVDAAGAIAQLDELGEEVAAAVATNDAIAACVEVLAGTHGFEGDAEAYDNPANSMLDVVLARRRGLPILLSVVYVEVGRRAGVPLAGVGLPGHFVVGHFGGPTPLLIDPFHGGVTAPAEGPAEVVRPWSSQEIAMRMLNNLVGSYHRRGNVGAAIRAAEMRLLLPSEPELRDSLRTELGALRARLN